ncbi:hypothetical protein B0A55_06162 [Friedmanniomyces simplex]|uniref:Fe2OG dioxygenase domain-containing protein n=1 Tax=Friedmanniomyces simplex TaxID=329884 RepID=A0A4U0X0X2_9PEZI|nr:hypothetical protein B0A55_06162 [Friedmanniomyces simplex]
MKPIVHMSAQHVVTPMGSRRRYKADNLPESLILSARTTDPVVFDPAKHLAFRLPQKILTFDEVGQSNDGISSNAVSEPFSLFTEEAVKQMRAEVFREDILEKCYCATGRSSGQVRGHCPKDVKFICDAWNSPEVLNIISEVAGVDLVPAIDYDIGHRNISINADGNENDCVAPGEATDDSAEFCESAFGWHRDSYPFVVVTMLSDCDGMIGGETAILTGAGTILRARGPARGTAVVMQGRYVDHQATAAMGGREQISMVTSFRPKSHHIKDETTLRGVRNISHVPTLYTQYTEYRLENLERRVHDELTKLRKRKRTDGGSDVRQTRDWLREQRGFLDAMLSELQVH